MLFKSFVFLTILTWGFVVIIIIIFSFFRCNHWFHEFILCVFFLFVFSPVTVWLQSQSQCSYSCSVRHVNTVICSFLAAPRRLPQAGGTFLHRGETKETNLAWISAGSDVIVVFVSITRSHGDCWTAVSLDRCCFFPPISFKQVK